VQNTHHIAAELFICAALPKNTTFLTEVRLIAALKVRLIAAILVTI
jgi:hypothetical protein